VNIKNYKTQILNCEESKTRASDINRFISNSVDFYGDIFSWVNDKYLTPSEINEYERSIYCVKHKSEIAALLLLKDTASEKKICHLNVAKPFRNSTIGRDLFLVSHDKLNDEKPLITLDQTKLPQFEKLFNEMGYDIVETLDNKYWIGNKELVFNKRFDN